MAAIVQPGPEQENANKETQALACQAIRLLAGDMVGVATGDRPLEADFCPFGWGTTAYQLSPDPKTLNVLGMYGGSLSLAQSNWRPRKGDGL